MTNVRSWLKNRSAFSDWEAVHETRDRKLANLDWLSSSSGAIAAHPGPMLALRWCVGLQRLGGILAEHGISRTGFFFDPGEPEAVDGQWLLQRNLLSDWLAERRSRDRKLVSLEHQAEGFCPSPLATAMLRSVVGLVPLGGISYPYAESRTTVSTAEDDLLLDALSSEELHVLITEDTGEPLGTG